MSTNETPILSLVVPCYNEQDNLRALLAAIRAAMEPLQLAYEVVITDDCSRDKLNVNQRNSHTEPGHSLLQ